MLPFPPDPSYIISYDSWVSPNSVPLQHHSQPVVHSHPPHPPLLSPSQSFSPPVDSPSHRLESSRTQIRSHSFSTQNKVQAVLDKLSLQSGLAIFLPISWPHSPISPSFLHYLIHALILLWDIEDASDKIDAHPLYHQRASGKSSKSVFLWCLQRLDQCVACSRSSIAVRGVIRWVH